MDNLFYKLSYGGAGQATMNREEKPKCRIDHFVEDESLPFFRVEGI